jgi:hypothetical protein
MIWPERDAICAEKLSSTPTSTAVKIGRPFINHVVHALKRLQGNDIGKRKGEVKI